jgi:hypothetical protein
MTGAATASGRRGAGASGGGGARSARLRGAAAWTLGTAVAGAALFTCYLLQSRTVPAGSDGASIALQAWDMLHGNPLLRGWRVADVSFYTTELPQYAAIESVRGLSADVIHVGGAMTYTLLVLLAAYLARGRARGRAGLARAVVGGGIMLAPQLGAGTGTLLLGPDHTGSAVPVLVVLLLLDLAPARWYVPVLAGLVLAWGLVADALVLFIGVAPVVLVCIARVLHGVIPRNVSPLRVIPRRPGSARGGEPGLRGVARAWWFELSLAAAAAAAVPVAAGAVALIRALGGWQPSSLRASFATAGMIAGNIRLTAQGLLGLFGADVFGASSGLAVVFAAVHLAGFAVAGWGFCIAVRRFFRADALVEAVCVAAIVINLAAYLAGVQVVNIASSREIAPVLPLGAVLAGRLLGERLLAPRLMPVAAVVLAGYAAMLGYAAAQPAQAPQYADLTGWLRAHHLTSGVSGYSQANIVTAESNGAISLRPVVAAGRYIAPRGWESDRSWFDPARHTANFLVLSGFGPYQVSAREAVATFGQPARTYRYRVYTIMVWNTNLLARLR